MRTPESVWQGLIVGVLAVVLAFVGSAAFVMAMDFLLHLAKLVP